MFMSLAQEREKYWNFVNTVMNIQVSIHFENF